MAYKPTTGTSILDNDFRLATSEGVYEALQLKQDALPSQSGNADKVLVSDGSALSWQYAGLGSGNFGTDNVILAQSKPASFTGNSTVLLGANAGNSLTSATNTVAIGANTLTLVTNASNNTAIGPSAGRYVLGVNNIFIGSQAGQGNSDGVSSTAQYNVGIGLLTLSSVTSGIGNMAIGSTALSSLQAAHGNVAIGNEAGRYYSPISGYTGAVLIGNTAGRGNATTPANNTHTNTVAIGISSLSKLENGGSNVAIGALTLSEVTSAGHNTAIGNSAGRRITGPNNVFIGSDAGSGSATPANNTANAVVVIGRQAGSGITSLGNSVLIGQLTGQSLTNQINETFVGWRCGRYSVGSNNTYFGAAAGSGNTNGTSSTGTLNTAVGSYAGHFLEGSGNTLFGYNAGSAITTGSNNTIIGYNNGTTTLTSTIIMLAGNAERFRVDSSGNMGIGTSTPSEKLEVAGAVLATEYRVPNYRLDPHTHDEGTETGNFTINWANGAVHTVTLNAAGPLVITMSNPVNGGAYALRIIQGATPGTVTWPANVKWPGGTPPTLSSSTGDIDIVNFLYFDDGGGNTFYYGTIAQDFA